MRLADLPVVDTSLCRAWITALTLSTPPTPVQAVTVDHADLVDSLLSGPARYHAEIGFLILRRNGHASVEVVLSTSLIAPSRRHSAPISQPKAADPGLARVGSTTPVSVSSQGDVPGLEAMLLIPARQEEVTRQAFSLLRDSWKAQ
ncbi:hypothetical protein [Bilophila wadsworthia]|uniref:hypothetical protein n=1 Tax=Bilophila wadsworthia TaxID=35833 RepID=UPI002430D32A|nr:hypothetical protein [Bilophila wadsworthia]